jgi:hypothetical protein
MGGRGAKNPTKSDSRCEWFSLLIEWKAAGLQGLVCACLSPPLTALEGIARPGLPSLASRAWRPPNGGAGFGSVPRPSKDGAIVFRSAVKSKSFSSSRQRILSP